MSVQHLTIQKNKTDVEAKKCQPFNYAHERFIEWYAAEGQLIWSLDSFAVVKRPALAQLAREVGVSRQTLYQWPMLIKSFQERVEEARRGLIIANTIAVWNSIFLKACRGDMKAAELYLTQYDPYFVSSKQLVKKRADTSRGLVDLLQESRQNLASDNSDQSSTVD